MNEMKSHLTNQAAGTIQRLYRKINESHCIGYGRNICTAESSKSSDLGN